MRQKILVAIDNSAFSHVVFDRALELAKALSASLLLVHSLSGEDESSPLPVGAQLDAMYWAPGTELNLEAWKAEWSRYEAENLKRLQEFSATAKGAGLETEFHQLVGAPGKVICKAAQRWNADLIVVGHRGRSGLSELILGSVSNYVMHYAPCSVIVVKDPTDKDSETFPEETMTATS